MKISRAAKLPWREVVFEPSGRMADYGLQRAKLRKEMTRARNDFQLLGAAQASQGMFVQLDHHEIVTPDDQKRRCPHLVEGIASKVRTPSARDNRTDPIRKFCRGNQRSRSTGTGTEQAERNPL